MSMHSTASAHYSARLVSKNLEEAIAAYEVYVPSGTDRELIGRVNALAIHPGFNVISASLHHVVVISLCRIWDKGRQTASIWSLRRKLTSPGIQAEFEELRGSSIDQAHIAAWATAVDATANSEELGAIKATRDLWLAHTKSPDRLYQGNARQEIYGDERRVIEMTIPLLEEANALIGYTFFPFADLHARWNEETRKFWAALPDIKTN